MSSVRLLELGAWAASALFGLWLLFDLIRTNRAYPEDMLMSSREGEIEDEPIIDPTMRDIR